VPKRKHRGPFKPFDLQAAQQRVHTRVLKASTVADMWQLFYDEVLGRRLGSAGFSSDEPASQVLILMMRDAFYAGSASILDLMMKVSADEISEEDGAVMLGHLHDEMKAFGASREPRKPS
jgi:hypothetical protein